MAQKKYNVSYKRCGFIVHGKSELHIVKYICSNLHIPHVLFASSQGRSSIQINGVNSILNKYCKSLKSFAENNSIEYDHKTRKLVNFKLFVLMDTDDCTEDMKQKFISGEMFRNHILGPYIVPVYCSENLEDVMIKAGIMVKRISDSQKDSYYSKIFPIHKDSLTQGTIEEIRHFGEQLKSVNETNMEEMIGHCILGEMVPVPTLHF